MWCIYICNDYIFKKSNWFFSIIKCHSLSVPMIFHLFCRILVLTSLLFWIPSAWHFAFNLCVSLDLKWVSGNQHIKTDFYFLSVHWSMSFWCESLLHLHLNAYREWLTIDILLKVVCIYFGFLIYFLFCYLPIFLYFFINVLIYFSFSFLYIL